jgi:hypothetical protein
LFGAGRLAERERARQCRAEPEEFSACIFARNKPPSELLNSLYDFRAILRPFSRWRETSCDSLGAVARHTEPRIGPVVAS